MTRLGASESDRVRELRRRIALHQPRRTRSGDTAGDVADEYARRALVVKCEREIAKIELAAYERRARAVLLAEIDQLVAAQGGGPARRREIAAAYAYATIRELWLLVLAWRDRAALVRAQRKETAA